MRELFDDQFQPTPADPMKSAAAPGETAQRRRFYKEVAVADAGDGFAVMLDGKSVRTPAKRSLVVPLRAIASGIADEWNAQAEFINPFSMPLTRLANSIIDGVTDRISDVSDDVIKYAGTDLLFYRAGHPEGLVARESEHWDPVLAWIGDTFGARFMLAEGIVHVRQSDQSLSALRAAIPQDPWRLGALHAATTLTGSALLALALAHGHRDAKAVWAAAHVDEDWNMERWGRDESVLARRQARFAELQATEKVLRP